MLNMSVLDLSDSFGTLIQLEVEGSASKLLRPKAQRAQASVTCATRCHCATAP